MKKHKKSYVYQEYNQILNESSIIIAMHYNNLVRNKTNLEQQKIELRKLVQNNSVYEKDLQFKVIKNTLMRKVLANTQYASFADCLHGPTLLVYTNKNSAINTIDFVKQLLNWQKERTDFIVLGAKYNDSFVSATDISFFGNLSNNILLEQTKLMSLLVQNISQISGTLTNSYLPLLLTTQSITNLK
jgi:ribosomal protein L10